MADLADGFIALPGGFGTLEELFEIITWGQLRIHGKPYGLLNICGYYDRLIDFLQHTVNERFVKDKHHSVLMVEVDAGALLDRMAQYRPPNVEKIDRRVR